MEILEQALFAWSGSLRYRNINKLSTIIYKKQDKYLTNVDNEKCKNYNIIYKRI